ncbi:hypothetical protein M758_UG275000 [Ceratodon purpureus]|nr:hypothetical protein M758_UG275000 [Ceratodon purpureus]
MVLVMNMHFSLFCPCAADRILAKALVRQQRHSRGQYRSGRLSALDSEPVVVSDGRSGNAWNWGRIQPPSWSKRWTLMNLQALALRRQREQMPHGQEGAIA